MKTIKANLWLYIQNNGDGSCSVKFFPTEKAAESCAEKCNERYCDDVYPKELEFDLDGNLLTK